LGEVKDTATQTVGIQNFVGDFSQSQLDQIQFSGVAGVTTFADLSFDTTTTPGSTIIQAGADQVTVVGFTGTLTTNDISVGSAAQANTNLLVNYMASTTTSSSTDSSATAGVDTSTSTTSTPTLTQPAA
jgi:hypothetical protein